MCRRMFEATIPMVCWYVSCLDQYHDRPHPLTSFDILLANVSTLAIYGKLLVGIDLWTVGCAAISLDRQVRFIWLLAC